ncbi:MAG: hypothetical protein MZV63_64305 [Marinilabiliales bacterium]|nr:hypothetical protein [Marinilabiliales bacterium]
MSKASSHATAGSSELRYFEDYSYEEIATELSLPLGTVKARLFRAKALILNMIRSKKNIL